MDKQEQLLEGISQLVTVVNRLVEALGGAHEGRGSDIDMSPEPITDGVQSEMVPETVMLTAAGALQEVQLGYEIDQCSGVLTGRNRFGQWVTVPRGQMSQSHARV